MVSTPRKKQKLSREKSTGNIKSRTALLPNAELRDTNTAISKNSGVDGEASRQLKATNAKNKFLDARKQNWISWSSKGKKPVSEDTPCEHTQTTPSLDKISNGANGDNIARSRIPSNPASLKGLHSPSLFQDGGNGVVNAVSQPSNIPRPMSNLPSPLIRPGISSTEDSFSKETDTFLYDASPLQKAVTWQPVGSNIPWSLSGVDARDNGSKSQGLNSAGTLCDTGSVGLTNLSSPHQKLPRHSSVTATIPTSKLSSPQFFVELPRNILPTTPHNSVEMAFPPPKDGQNQDAKVTIILQNVDGSMNFDAPVPSHEFKQSTVEEFFALYALRTNTPLQHLSVLKFTIIFASRTKIVVKRSDSAQIWKVAKRRIASLLIEALEENPSETDFDVWVKAGDETNKIMMGDAFAGL